MTPEFSAFIDRFLADFVLIFEFFKVVLAAIAAPFIDIWSLLSMIATEHPGFTFCAIVVTWLVFRLSGNSFKHNHWAGAWYKRLYVRIWQYWYRKYSPYAQRWRKKDEAE